MENDYVVLKLSSTISEQLTEYLENLCPTCHLILADRSLYEKFKDDFSKAPMDDEDIEFKELVKKMLNYKVGDIELLDLKREIIISKVYPEHSQLISTIYDNTKTCIDFLLSYNDLYLFIIYNNYMEDEEKEEMFDKNVILKKVEYFSYIDDHRERVAKMAQLLFDMKLTSEKNMKRIIETHDLTKYSETEFEPYRKKWYRAVKEEFTDEDKLAYEKAWEHHYSTNPHHPEHYENSDGFCEMIPYDYIIEMIADWMAMSDKLQNDYKKTYEWFTTELDKGELKLHPMALQIVRELLKYICDIK